MSILRSRIMSDSIEFIFICALISVALAGCLEKEGQEPSDASVYKDGDASTILNDGPGGDASENRDNDRFIKAATDENMNGANDALLPDGSMTDATETPRYPEDAAMKPTVPEAGDATDEKDASAPAEANSIADFEFRGCKYQTEYSGGLLNTGTDSRDYSGLECVAWKTSENDHLVIDLINFIYPCLYSESEAPKITAYFQEEGVIKFDFESNLTYVYACGMCQYDWSFELSNVQTDKPLKLVIEEGASPVEIVLPLDSENTSIKCDYLSAWDNFPGTLNNLAIGGPCEPDLVEADVPGGRTLCMATCDRTSDCPLNHILSCEQGICRLVEPAPLW